MKLSELKPEKGARKRRMRVGRGLGSGKGTYAGRGGKGQTARTGGTRRPGFAGGQTPIHRRMPKLGGFKNPNRIEYQAVNVASLEKHFKDGDTVDVKALVEKGILRSAKMPIKLLGEGEITIALTIHASKASKTAIEKVEKAKGKVELKKA